MVIKLKKNVLNNEQYIRTVTWVYFIVKRNKSRT